VEVKRKIVAMTKILVQATKRKRKIKMLNPETKVASS
jgi:hypothetical protein